MFGDSKLSSLAETMLLSQDFENILEENDLTLEDVLTFLLDNGMIDYGLYRSPEAEE